MATFIGENRTFYFFRKVLDDKQVKLPLSLAILLHLIAFGLVTMPPSIFHRTTILEEIYTVDLFDLEEPATQDVSPPAPAPAKIESPPEPIESKTPEPVLSTAQEPQVMPSPPAEIISLTPRKVKKKIQEEKPKLAKSEEQEIKKALEKLKLQRQREAAEKRAQEARATAEAAARDAINSLRASIQTSSQVSTNSAVSRAGSSTTRSGARGKSGNIQVDIALKQYYIAISDKIHQHWILPEMQKWDQNLEAVVVINVRRDGIVTKREFEKKSANLFFNQFVEKTLRESLPLPPFPAGLKDNELEIGLVFHPGGLM